MKLRIMTIASVFSIALVAPMAAFAAESPSITNPLRSPNRGLLFGSAPDDMPSPTTVHAAPPRSPPGLWRNPSSIQTPEIPARSSENVAPGSPSAPPTAASPDAGQPPRTLLQRLRERRLAQLEKQAQRLRELAQQEDARPLDAQGTPDPNGPENPDLQIDLGVPLEGSAPAHTSPPPPGSARSLDYTPLIGPYPAPGSEPPAGRAPSELTPPADPPIEIQIELPDDPVPAQPQPPIQARLRNWWSPTTR